MRVDSFSHTPAAGWSLPALPALDSPQTVVLAFGAPLYDGQPQPLLALARAYPQAVVVGCSTAGEILGGQAQDEGLVVAAARFERTRLRLAVAPLKRQADSQDAGRALAGQLAGPDLCAVFLLADGLVVNGSALLTGLHRALPVPVPVVGALAGDGRRFLHTWVLHEGQPQSGLAVALGFYGDDFVLGHATRSGWQPFGPERHISRAEGSVLMALDQRPALDLYKAYLGKYAAGLPASAQFFPLQVWSEHAGQPPAVRAVLAVDEARDALVLAGDAPEGGVARLLRFNYEQLIDAASDAAWTLPPAVPGQALTLIFSGAGRRLALGERAGEELEVVLDALPEGARPLGFYSYGEFCPDAQYSGTLQNQSITLVTLGER